VTSQTSESKRVARTALPKFNRGFSLLELVVVIGIISVLLVIAIDRLRNFQIAAERVAMEQVLGALRSAIGIEMSRRVVTEGFSAVIAMDGQNPMNYLAQRPYNYLGELDGVDPETIQGSIWYFDKSVELLVYRVDNEAWFKTELEGKPRAEFRQTLVYTDQNNNGRFDRGDEVGGFGLSPVSPYRWLISTDNFADLK